MPETLSGRRVGDERQHENVIVRRLRTTFCVGDHILAIGHGVGTLCTRSSVGPPKCIRPATPKRPEGRGPPGEREVNGARRGCSQPLQNGREESG